MAHVDTGFWFTLACEKVAKLAILLPTAVWLLSATPPSPEQSAYAHCYENHQDSGHLHYQTWKQEKQMSSLSYVSTSCYLPSMMLASQVSVPE
jgi:hypothetical protein